MGAALEESNEDWALLLTRTNRVNQPPIASWEASPEFGAAPLEVMFNATASYDSDGSIIDYSWDFGDNHTGQGQAITHEFKNPGNYMVVLTVTDNEGATATHQMAITVMAPGTCSEMITMYAKDFPIYGF